MAKAKEVKEVKKAKEDVVVKGVIVGEKDEKVLAMEREANQRLRRWFEFAGLPFPTDK